MVKESKSFYELARKIGYESQSGSVQATLKKVVAERNLDTSHFLGQGWNKGNFDYERFQYGKAIKSANARKALEALRGSKCECCGLENWLDKPIILEVHHIDGDHLNNQIENLKLLCPNCHSLTENWRGKNISKSYKEPILEERFVQVLKES